jgi:hypothetical protein
MRRRGSDRLLGRDQPAVDARSSHRRHYGCPVLSTLLAQVSWLPAVVLLLTVLAGPFVGTGIVRRPKMLRVLWLVSLLLLAGLTLYPEDGAGRDVACTIEAPYFSLRVVETLANVLLFIPPVVLTGLVFRRPVLAALAGSAASALIELGQAVLPAIGRACDTGDWISNTTGAVLGALIGTTALSLARRRQNHTTGH